MLRIMLQIIQILIKINKKQLLFGVIEAGKAYNVDLTFNGDFRPESEGGNGGGGDDNPDKPNISANVGITVTPAEWTNTSTPKPFE